jgi:hypothetical protein
MFDDVFDNHVKDDKSLIQFLFFVLKNDNLILLNHLYQVNLFLNQFFQFQNFLFVFQFHEFYSKQKKAFLLNK